MKVQERSPVSRRPLGLCGGGAMRRRLWTDEELANFTGGTQLDLFSYAEAWDEVDRGRALPEANLRPEAGRLAAEASAPDWHRLRYFVWRIDKGICWLCLEEVE